MVLATGTPILDRGLHFAKVEPQRSYVLAFDHAQAPTGMYISAGSSTRSVRDSPPGTLLVGGSGHGVGRTPSEEAHLDELRAWTGRYFPGAVETHAWSAQDYSGHDGLPQYGALPGSRGRIHVATGFDKWGMTNGVAAARAIAGRLLGEESSWAAAMQQHVSWPAVARGMASINGRAGINAVSSFLSAELRSRPADPPEGRGRTGRDGALPVAVSTVDNTTCAVSGLCTHLGGTLRWNDAEKSWDCPLHGSRFDPTGAVLEGPATAPLPRRS